jgi:signal transduction histidine kinase
MSSPAARLRANKQRILQEWETLVRRQLSAARNESHPVLINSLPDYLEHLAQALDPAASRELATSGTNSAKEHGGIRARLTNYSLEQLIRETQILRRVVFKVLEEEGPLDPKSREILLASIDCTIRETSQGFMDAHGGMRQDDLAAIVHDLTGPLTAAHASTQLIERYPERSEEHPKLAARASQSLTRLNRMVHDILDANRLGAGQKLPFELAECELGQMVGALLEQLVASHGERFVIKASGPIQGIWNCQALRRAIENLASNAVKYGDPDAPVTLTLASEHERATIQVHNFGNPIDSRDQERLFVRHHRLASAQGAATGWGLGLPLVKGIVEAHGGSISVDSSRERGTTFTIDIPLDSRPFQQRSA